MLDYRVDGVSAPSSGRHAWSNMLSFRCVCWSDTSLAPLLASSWSRMGKIEYGTEFLSTNFQSSLVSMSTVDPCCNTSRG
ncbi:hypothetical protein HZ326_6951 [Fusarium oxysporum f. sp. albedinis]|nr:hypothetical protein HZ326_6951 [Fusarium oxysporum f. sp. albedinis]